MGAPPDGTVTMLFTDIEGSTVLAQELGTGWGDVLRDHHEVLSAAIAAHAGHVDGTEGDAFFAVFGDARAALAAATDAQRALRGRRWPTATGALKVRMGLHTGFVERRVTGYVGLEIHRAARVASAANGGQILLTAATRSLVGDAVALADLGHHRLKDFPAPERLYAAVLDEAGPGPAPRTLEVRPTNLPADHRPLIGRDADLAAVVAAFTEDGERLVTLTGMGGTGKTRLALAAGSELLDAHPGGVWWVPLAAEDDVAAVAPLLAAALHVEDKGTQALPELLAARIGTTPLLAVLDNLEQLPGITELVADLLAVAPGLRILATSQAPLRLTTERVLALEPLAPGAASELFASIAARIRPGLALDPSVVAELCERLDHSPLAIELAAGRLSVLSPEQILERLSAPLKLLRSGDRDRPERQRSLRATIDWTLGLLDPGARALFTRLGAFAGAVELEDIEAVCEDDDLDVLEAAATLLDVGILRRREDGSGVVRLRLPESLRQVARDELDASPDGARWRRAHAERMAAAAEDAGMTMTASAKAYLRAQALDGEARLALDWAWDHDPVLAARIAGPVAGRWVEDGRVAESRELTERALSVPDLPPRVRAFALLGRAYRQMLGDATESIEADCLEARALVGPEDALHRYVSTVLVWLATVTGRDARPRAEEALALARARGSGGELASALTLSFQAELAAGNVDAAEALLAEGARVAHQSEAKMVWHLATCFGDLALVRGDAAGAANAYADSMSAAFERSDLVQVLLDLLGIAAALAGAGCDAAALEARGLAEGLAAETGISVSVGVPGIDELGRAAERLGAEAATAATERGRAVPIGRRVDRARELARAAAATAAPS